MATLEEVLALMQEDEFDGLDTLQQMGQEAVPPLVEILTDTTQPEFLRQRAIVALGEIGDPAAAPAVQPFTTHANAVFRYMAANALVKMVGPAATDTLNALLSDDDPSVVKTAVRGLAEVGDATALAALAQVQASSPHEFLRADAATAVQRIEERTA